MTQSLAEAFRDRLGFTNPGAGGLSLSEVFREEPVDLTTFVTDRAHLGNPRLSDLQYEAIRHYEQVLYPETYVRMVEEFGDYWQPVRYVNFITLLWGKGSGKDHICRIANLRIIYLLLCLRSPQTYFGLPEQDSIHILNVASSAPQANRAYFQPFRRIVERKGSWFRDKCHPTVGAVQFENNVEAISGHSDPESQEGLNLLAGTADEIDAFQSRDNLKANQTGRNTAEAVVEMMRTSARTRFAANFKLAVISYPRYAGSPIMKRHTLAMADVKRKGEQSEHFYSGPYATWEVNPRVRGKDDFQEDYDEDPIMAAAKYECRPSGAQNPYFRNQGAIYSSFSRMDPDPVTFHYEWIKDAESVEGRPAWSGWECRFSISPSLRPIAGALYAMHADLAATSDRAGVAMSHIERFEQRGWEARDAQGGIVTTVETRPIVKSDFVLSFEADLSTEPVPREIRLAWARELCFELLKLGFPILLYTYDGWQSLDSQQILNGYGIESKRQSVDIDPAPYRNLRELAYEGRLNGGWRDRVIQELLGLEQLKNGRVDHPPGGSKDEADALAGSVYGAIALGGSEAAGREERSVSDRAATSLVVQGAQSSPLRGVEDSDVRVLERMDAADWWGAA